MLDALASLLVFQFAGEFAVPALGLPAPGPATGMGLLFVALAFGLNAVASADLLPFPPELPGGR